MSSTKHLWIIRKDSSLMLFYHNYDNPPYKAMIVSGLLAAMNNFSEIEIQERGIQSIEMHDMRWVYLNCPEHNLLVIAADNKNSSSKLMRARAKVILDMFIRKYHIDLGYWEDNPINLDVFADFQYDLRRLEEDWTRADEKRDIGEILDLLGIFQHILIKYIDLINQKLTVEENRIVLQKLNLFSPQLREWYKSQYNPESFQFLKLYIPRVDLEAHKIYFTTSPGQNILDNNTFGLEPEYIKGFFYMILQYYTETIESALKYKHLQSVFFNEFIPYFLQQWDILTEMGILKELMNTIFHPFLE